MWKVLKQDKEKRVYNFYTFDYLWDREFEKAFAVSAEDFLEHLCRDVVSNTFEQTLWHLDSPFVEFKDIIKAIKLVWSAVEQIFHFGFDELADGFQRVSKKVWQL